MGKVVRAPMRFHRRRIVRGAEIHAQSEPPDEMVWDMCVYTRRFGSGVTDDDMRCQGCPQWETDPSYGKVQRMCYGMAKEACQLAMAWQKRMQK